jgi:hypothetical protein
MKQGKATRNSVHEGAEIQPISKMKTNKLLQNIKGEIKHGQDKEKPQ